MSVAIIRESSLGPHIGRHEPLDDAGLNAAFDRVSAKVVGSVIFTCIKQGLGLSDPLVSKSLKIRSRHDCPGSYTLPVAMIPRALTCAQPVGVPLGRSFDHDRFQCWAS